MEIDKQKLRCECLAGTILSHPGHATKLEDLASWGQLLGDFKPIFKCIVNMGNKHIPITVTSLVTEVCKETKTADSSCWQKIIEECARKKQSSSKIEGLIRDIEEVLVRRKLNMLANKILMVSADAHSNTEGMLDMLETGVADIRNSQGIEASMDMNHEADNIMREIADAQSGGESPFIPTGIPALDSKINGLTRGKLYTIGARPGIGKSALATCMAISIAHRGIPVGIVSLEMSKEAMIKRLAQQMSGIEADKLFKSYDEDKYQQLKQAVDKIKSLPIKIVSPDIARASNVKNVIRKMVYNENCQVIFMDYIQKVSKDHPKESTEQTVTKASEAMRVTAKSVNVPIVQLSQMNRFAEGNRPLAGHIKDSDMILSDSHVVMLIERDRDFHFSNTVTSQECNLWLAKNRDGDEGKVPVVFIGQDMRFLDRRTYLDMKPRLADNGPI